MHKARFLRQFQHRRCDEFCERSQGTDGNNPGWKISGGSCWCRDIPRHEESFQPSKNHSTFGKGCPGRTDRTGDDGFSGIKAEVQCRKMIFTTLSFHNSQKKIGTKALLTRKADARYEEIENKMQTRMSLRFEFKRRCRNGVRHDILGDYLTTLRSSSVILRKSATFMLPLSPSLRLRTETTPSATSFSPTMRRYGTFWSSHWRIL